ncbi:response regulator [Tenacibaculum sp. UWU-22]|uniref:response regulator n=1 Tax=Tenacibaculum sp. UWU-22 TaxID=3234187 RepID=UPI0034DB6680
MGKNINILIVEDNVIIADDLESTLQEIGYNVIDKVISFEKALESLENNIIDLVFLDVFLATKKTGIDLANYINANYKIPFIYLTSNSDSETIEEATKTFPYAYLVKPFDKNNIYTAIELALANYNAKDTTKHFFKDSFFIKNKNIYCKILIKNITYIKSDNVYLEIHTINNKKHILRSTLKNIILKLPNNFYKCNKSYIININYLDSFSSGYVFINNEKIPISKEFKPIIKSLLNKY